MYTESAVYDVGDNYEGKWGVYRMLCQACDARWVAVASYPDTPDALAHCPRCSQMAGRAYIRYRRADKRQMRRPWSHYHRKKRKA